jgi:SAM-dependent methyltransferase
MTKHGSDKANRSHNYTTVYAKLFRDLQDRPIRILELGIGTTNPQIACNMGAGGISGASLRGWREIFPDAHVFGADIDREILFEDERIQTFYCDQLHCEAIRNLWVQPALQSGMDIIIDDGLHTFPANAQFLAESLENLRPGGFYIVEDIRNTYFGMWQEHLPNLARQFPGCDFALAAVENPFNKFDNNLLIIQRRP